MERYLKESLLVNVYITGIENIAISIDGSKVDVNFIATTVYGDVIITPSKDSPKPIMRALTDSELFMLLM